MAPGDPFPGWEWPRQPSPELLGELGCAHRVPVPLCREPRALPGCCRDPRWQAGG